MLTSGANVMPPAGLTEAAARVLCYRGYLDPHDMGEWPDELAGELAALVELGCCPSCPVTLTPHALADHWLARKEDEYDRALPTWTCDCGAVYKLVSEWGGHSEFYELGDDALLGPLCAGAARPDSDETVKDRDGRPQDWTQPYPDGIYRAGTARSGRWLMFPSIVQSG